MWVSASIPTCAVARDLGRLAGGAVGCLARALGLLLGKRRLVHEQIGLVRGDDQRLAWRRVARDHDLAPRTLAARAPARGSHRSTVSPRCSRPKSGPGLTPSRSRQLRIQVPGASVLDERVAVAGVALVTRPGWRRSHSRRPPRSRRCQLDDAQLIRQPPVDEARRLHQLAQPARPVHAQRLPRVRAGQTTSASPAIPASGRHESA